MMKILIVSDTHRKHQNYQEIVNRLQPLDMVIHCGDAEGSEYILSEIAQCPFHIVLGNNDFFSELPKELELKIGKYNVLVTHGHSYYVSMGNEVIKSEAINRGKDIVIYGHTHRPIIDKEDEIIAINPGSISFPRQEKRKPSYIIMEIDKEEEAHFTIGYL